MVDDAQLWTENVENFNNLKGKPLTSQIYSDIFQVNFSLVRYLIL